MHQQPPWMCNNEDCRFRNRLLADARLTTPHTCPQPTPIPVFVNPFPLPKPITILPPPPLAPAPPGSFYFPPPNFPPPAPPATFPIPTLPPAPMPPGPFMLPAPVALPAPQALPPQQSEQKPSPPKSPDPEKSPPIGNVVHEKNVHTFKPTKGRISKEHKDALSDFEERTRRQEYRDLAASSKASEHQSEASPAKNPASAPRSILKYRQAPTPAAINQEVHVNVYNTGHGSKNMQKSDGADSSQSGKSIPAKDAATVREEAIKRAHSLAHGIAGAAAPAAIMSGALKPPSMAGCHPAFGPPSHTSKTGAPKPASSNAPSHTSKVGPPKPAPSNALSKHSSHPSTAGTQAHKSKNSRAGSHHPSPLAIATATAKAQDGPDSIESWRKGVKKPIAGA